MAAAAGRGPRKATGGRIFNDPQLNALEEQVAISNQNVLAAEAQFRQARALVQAAQAGYFPTVALGATPPAPACDGQRLHRSSTTLNLRTTLLEIPGSGVTPAAKSSLNYGHRTNYSLPATLSWEPDFWGSSAAPSRPARPAPRPARPTWRRSGSERQAELAQDYFQLRTLDARNSSWTPRMWPYGNPWN